MGPAATPDGWLAPFRASETVICSHRLIMTARTLVNRSSWLCPPNFDGTCSRESTAPSVIDVRESWRHRARPTDCGRCSLLIQVVRPCSAAGAPPAPATSSPAGWPGRAAQQLRPVAGGDVTIREHEVARHEGDVAIAGESTCRRSRDSSALRSRDPPAGRLSSLLMTGASALDAGFRHHGDRERFLSFQDAPAATLCGPPRPAAAATGACGVPAGRRYQPCFSPASAAPVARAATTPNWPLPLESRNAGRRQGAYSSNRPGRRRAG